MKLTKKYYKMFMKIHIFKQIIASLLIKSTTTRIRITQATILKISNKKRT